MQSFSTFLLKELQGNLQVARGPLFIYLNKKTKKRCGSFAVAICATSGGALGYAGGCVTLPQYFQNCKKVDPNPAMLQEKWSQYFRDLF